MNKQDKILRSVCQLVKKEVHLGFLLVLLGWAAFLANALTLLGPLAFVRYLNRFQIVPEERALSAQFKAEYAAYKAKVRRWL